MITVLIHPDSNECSAVLNDKPQPIHPSLPPASPTPGNNNIHIIILVTTRLICSIGAHPPTPATHHHLFAFALEEVPSSASASSHQPVVAEGSGPRGHPRATRHLARRLQLFRPRPSGHNCSSPSPCFSPSISPCTPPIPYRCAVAQISPPRDANHSFDRLPNARSTENPQLGHRSAVSPTLEPLSLQHTPVPSPLVAESQEGDRHLCHPSP